MLSAVDGELSGRVRWLTMTTLRCVERRRTKSYARDKAVFACVCAGVGILVGIQPAHIGNGHQKVNID